MMANHGYYKIAFVKEVDASALELPYSSVIQ